MPHRCYGFVTSVPRNAFRGVTDGVSKAWLYKEPEIKARIEHLRTNNSKSKEIPSKQRSSDASKDAIIKTLKERIKNIKADNKDLREQHEAIYGHGGWLSSAIDDGWQPNQPLGEESHPADLFSEWYGKAWEFGIVIGNRKEDDGSLWVQENTSQWVLFEEFFSKWTLEYLRLKKTR